MKNKNTVLVTGASRGIGREIARLFAENNYNVVVNYNNSVSHALSLIEDIRSSGGSAIAVKADVSNRGQVNDMIDIALHEFGHIDTLINNAAISQFALFSDISEQMWDDMFSINVKGCFNCIQATLPSMIHEKYGKIINVSSIWGMVGASCEVSYSAAKAAIIGLTKGLAKEVGPSGITVNCVAPGVIETEMNNAFSIETIEALKEETPLGFIGNPKDVSELMLFLCSDKARFITGQVISPNGGLVI